MLAWLASLIGGTIVNGLIDGYKAKLDAANTHDRIAADLAAKDIEGEIAARQQASAIIIAEQGRWYTAIIRPLLALWGARFADVLLPSCYTTRGDTTR